MSKKEQTLQTVDRALSFLEYVASSPTAPTIKDVSDFLGLNNTTCYHLLRTLTARGYIEKRDDGRLQLGDRVSVFAQLTQRVVELEKVVSPALRQLFVTTTETCTISLYDGKHVVLRQLMEGSQRLRVLGLKVGLKGNEHKRAAGQAVLAHLPESRRAALLDEALAGRTLGDRAKILADLDVIYPLIRERGWALDDQSVDGFKAYAAPIFDAGGTVCGAISLVAPSFRLDRDLDRFIGQLLAAGSEATSLIRHSGMIVQNDTLMRG